MNNQGDKPPSRGAKRKIFDLLSFGKNQNELGNLDITVIRKLIEQFLPGDEKKDDIVTNIVLATLLSASHTVRDIMVGKSSVVTLGPLESIETMLKKVVSSGHSRFPVINEEYDILGIITAKDLLAYYLESDNKDDIFPKDRYRICPRIPVVQSVPTLLERFRKDKIHMAAVVDEYSNFEGIVTIEDVLEELVGEIEDEHDPENGEAFTTDDDIHYTSSAFETLSDFNKKFPEHKVIDTESTTLLGAITAQADRTLVDGDKVALGDWIFAVTQGSEGRKIETVSFWLSSHQADNFDSSVDSESAS